MFQVNNQESRPAIFLSKDSLAFQKLAEVVPVRQKPKKTSSQILIKAVN